MLQWILKIPWVPKWTGYMWLSKGFSVRLLWTQYWAFRFHTVLRDWNTISFSLRKFSSWIYVIRLHSHFNIFGWHSVQLEYEVCCTSFASNPQSTAVDSFYHPWERVIAQYQLTVTTVGTHRLIPIRPYATLRVHIKQKHTTAHWVQMAGMFI